MNLKRIITALVIVAILAGGGYGLYQRATPATPVTAAVPVMADAAVQGSANLVSAEGEVVPLHQAALSSQLGGPVAEMYVTEGATVVAGQPLLRLAAPDLEIALRQAEAGMVQAQANVAVVRAQLAAAEAGVQTARVGVTAAEAQLALIQAGPSPEEIAAAESNVAAVQAAVGQAAAGRDVQLTTVRTSQIQAAEANVAAAMAEERALQEQYDTLIRHEILGTPEEQTRIALNAARARLQAAQSALNELQAGATAAERQAASATVAVAVAQRDAAEAQLALLLAGVKAEQVRVAEVGVAQAQAVVAQADVAILQAQAGLSQAEAAVLQAQTAVDAAQATLDRALLTAPFAGTVAAIAVEAGEVLAPGVPVVTLADFSAWQVETTDLSELDVVHVAVGDTVRVRIDALPDQTLSGTVTEISAVSRLNRGDVTYTVTIELNGADRLPLRWGMTVFVDIDSGTRSVR
jgi:HlyD family secretion protein